MTHLFWIACALLAGAAVALAAFSTVLFRGFAVTLAAFTLGAVCLALVLLTGVDCDNEKESAG